MSRAAHFYRDSLLPHLAGGLLGGLASGLLAAGLAAVAQLLVPHGVVLATAAGVIAMFALAEPTGLRVWRPSATRQVPRNFQRTKYHRTTALLWGIDLGFGWSTKQPGSAFLVVTLAAVAAGPDLALATGVLFGFARALTLILAAGSTSRDVVEARFDWLRHHPRVARLGTGALAGALTTTLLVNLV